MITEGQKIAKKLSTQVARETKKIKALLQEYNASQAVAGSTGSLTVADGLDSATLAQTLHPKLCVLTPTNSVCSQARTYQFIHNADTEQGRC